MCQVICSADFKITYDSVQSLVVYYFENILQLKQYGIT